MNATSVSQHGPGRFFRMVALWSVSLAAFWAVVTTFTAAGTWPLADFVEILAMAIAFSAFAGGVAHPMLHRESKWRLWSTVGASVILGTLVYAMLAYLAPWAHLWIRTVTGADALLTGGVMPPSELKALRGYLLERPGSIVEAHASASDPFLWAPNWVDYKLALPRAAGLLTLVNVGLGVLCATLSVDLRAGTRRRLRWGAGLASALAFLILDSAVASVIVANPDASAFAWSAISLAPHLVSLVLMGLAVRFTTIDRQRPLQGW